MRGVLIFKACLSQQTGWQCGGLRRSIKEITNATLKIALISLPSSRIKCDVSRRQAASLRPSPAPLMLSLNRPPLAFLFSPANLPSLPCFFPSSFELSALLHSCGSQPRLLVFCFFAFYFMHLFHFPEPPSSLPCSHFHCCRGLLQGFLQFPSTLPS